MRFTKRRIGLAAVLADDVGLGVEAFRLAEGAEDYGAGSAWPRCSRR